jgi:hypothetical protein
MTVQNAMPNSYQQLTTIAQWEELMLTMGIADGVASQPSAGDLKVTLNSGARTAVAAAGYAVIRGQLWGADASVSTAIPAASGSNRIDKLVLRLDRQATTAATVVQPVVITGTPSATPASPAILSTTRYQDILLAQWQSNSDSSLTALIDARQFAGTPVYIFTATSRPTPAKPAIGVETSSNSIMIWNGSAWNYIPVVQVATTTGSQNITGTSQNAITGLSIAVAAGQSVEFRAFVPYVGKSTQDAYLTMSGPATAAFRAKITYLQNNSPIVSRSQTAIGSNTGMQNSGCGNGTEGGALIEGTATFSASGNLVVSGATSGTPLGFQTEPGGKLTVTTL